MPPFVRYRVVVEVPNVERGEPNLPGLQDNILAALHRPVVVLDFIEYERLQPLVLRDNRGQRLQIELALEQTREVHALHGFQ